jgi:hypothetical protein
LEFTSDELDKYFYFFRDGEIVNQLIKQVIDYEDIEKRNYFLSQLWNYYCNNNNLKVIKFMSNNIYIIDNILGFKTVKNWYKYFKELLYNNYDSYQKNLTKSNIVLQILKYLKNYTGIYEDFIDMIKIDCDLEFGDSLMSILVKYPKITKILDLLNYQDINTLSNPDKIYTNLVRYGTYETFTYLMNNLKDYIFTHYRHHNSNFHYFLTQCLCNFDRRILKDMLELGRKNKIEYDIYNSNYDMDLKFLKIKTLTIENKKKKIKLLQNYIPENVLNNLVCNKIDDLDTGQIEFKTWLIKKVFQNIIYESRNLSFHNITRIFISVLMENNINFFKYFCSITSKFINYYEFIIIALKNNYFWYDSYIQELLKHCGKLKMESSVIKNKIMRNLKDINSYNYTKEQNKIIKRLDTMRIYNKLVRYMIDNDVIRNDLVIHNNNYLIHLNHNSNFKMFMACICNGISFSYVRDYYLQHSNYYRYFNFSINSWMCLYFLIKRLEFKKHYHSKKQHLTNFKSTIIDMKSRPPSKLPVLKKGGSLFYKDLDEMDNLLEQDSTPFVKAQHIEKLELKNMILNSNDICFSQKVDGILHENIDIDNLYPSLYNSQYDLKKLDGEWVEELGITLIFGCRSNQNLHTTVLEDYWELVNEHPMAKSIPIEHRIIMESDTPEMIKSKFEREVQDILNFISKSKNQSNLWWPKTVYYLNNFHPKKKLNILEILQEHQYQIYQRNETLGMDGIILMNQIKKDKIYKLKPSHYMTADLKIENKIMRCGWKENKWVPQEERTDKKYPNPPYVIKILEDFHHKPWSLQDIQKHIS